VIEELGFYDPANKDQAKQVFVNKARVEHWLKTGAQPSDTVKQLLKRAVDSGELAPATKPAA
jgi:small subunit ribosomal protein S16